MDLYRIYEYGYHDFGVKQINYFFVSHHVRPAMQCMCTTFGYFTDNFFQIRLEGHTVVKSLCTISRASLTGESYPNM